MEQLLMSSRQADRLGKSNEILKLINVKIPESAEVKFPLAKTQNL